MVARPLQRIFSQLGNIRAALEWSFGPYGDDEIATRLAAASTSFFSNCPC